MDLLIVMTGMSGGGAEKSLISFLHAIFAQDKTQVNIDLLLFKPKGIFMPQIPKPCNLLKSPKEVFCMAAGPCEVDFYKNITVKGIIGKLAHYFRRNAPKYKDLDDIQILWENWKSFIPELNKEYDVAMSYMHGATNYFVIDKCKAKKKYLYVHHDYSELTANHRYDHEYFSKADGILTVSPECVSSIAQYHNDIKDRIYSIENIQSSSIIHKMANAFYPQEYKDNKGIIVLSIGRLAEVKRFDRAIDASEILKSQGYKFAWYIIGQGPLMKRYQDLIKQKDLSDTVFLLGEKTNPYPYILNCDIFVQTSDNEGKSIVIDEAKMLARPIIVTDYRTIEDSIDNKVTGLIVQKNPYDIADAISFLINNPSKRAALENKLKSRDYSNELEINKYLNLWGLNNAENSNNC